MRRTLWRESPFGLVVAEAGHVPVVRELSGPAAERFRARLVAGDHAGDHAGDDAVDAVDAAPAKEIGIP